MHIIVLFVHYVADVTVIDIVSSVYSFYRFITERMKVVFLFGCKFFCFNDEVTDIVRECAIRIDKDSCCRWK